MSSKPKVPDGWLQLPDLSVVNSPDALRVLQNPAAREVALLTRGGVVKSFMPKEGCNPPPTQRDAGVYADGPSAAANDKLDS